MRALGTRSRRRFRTRGRAGRPRRPFGGSLPTGRRAGRRRDGRATGSSQTSVGPASLFAHERGRSSAIIIVVVVSCVAYVRGRSESRKHDGRYNTTIRCVHSHSRAASVKGHLKRRFYDAPKRIFDNASVAITRKEPRQQLSNNYIEIQVQTLCGKSIQTTRQILTCYENSFNVRLEFEFQDYASVIGRMIFFVNVFLDYRILVSKKL